VLGIMHRSHFQFHSLYLRLPVRSQQSGAESTGRTIHNAPLRSMDVND